MSTAILLLAITAAGVIGPALCWLIWKAIKVIASAEGYR